MFANYSENVYSIKCTLYCTYLNKTKLSNSSEEKLLHLNSNQDLPTAKKQLDWLTSLPPIRLPVIFDEHKI